MPGISPARPPVMTFEGIVERTREGELGARWWPAGGVLVTAWAGWRWIDNQEHRAGRTSDGAIASLELHLQR